MRRYELTSLGAVSDAAGVVHRVPPDLTAAECREFISAMANLAGRGRLADPGKDALHAVAMHVRVDIGHRVSRGYARTVFCPTAGGGRLMAEGGYEPIAVSRRIGAPASEIFRILADPARHRDLDGSGMLRGVVSGATISGVGDIFLMTMYFTELGEYEMNNHVVEYEPDRRIGWEPEAGRGHPNADPDASRQARWGQRWSFELAPDGPDTTIVTEIFDCSRVPEDERADIENGHIWVQSMTRTLERLDGLCARPLGAAGF